MTGIVAHTYPEWWLKLAGQVAHWSTDYSLFHNNSVFPFQELYNNRQISHNVTKSVVGYKKANIHMI